jgi:ketosteroid isomerase-like protein
MRRFVWPIIGLASLAASAACGPSVNVEQERTALMTVDREWSQTTKAPDKFVTYFADGATIYAPGMPMITGGDAIRKTFTEMSKAPGFALSWTATKADVSASGDMGTTVGTYEMTMGGTTEKGKYVTVWKKQADGTWKVAEDIFNADAVPKPPAGDHAMVAPSALKWGDPPPGLPAGARVALVSGNPAEGPYVIRAQLPANYRIPPHWHPTTENVTVLSGTVALGMGEKWDDSAMQDVPSGGFTSIPAEMRHFFVSKTASTIQIHGVGPFGITYLNSADDPRTAASR